MLIVGIGTAQAAPVSPAASNWSVSYGTARAAGTYTVVPSNFFFRTYTVDGQLSNTGSACYHVVYLVAEDLGALPYSSDAQCGPGTLPLHFETTVGPLGAVTVLVCQGQPDDNAACGPSQQL